MGIDSFGDLATSTMFRGHNARLQTEMDKLVQELASGQVSIRDTALGGSYRAISGIEQSLTRLDAYDLSATEAEGMADAMQLALGSVQETVEALSFDMLSAGTAGTEAQAGAMVASARQDFEAVVGWLNSDVAGRTLFGGVETDTPALAPADEILAALEAEIVVSGVTSADDIAATVEDWFAPGGGFDTLGYLGSTQALAPMQVGPGRTVSLEVTAGSGEIRDALSGIALAVMIDSPAVAATPDMQMALATRSGEILLNANQALLATRADLGAMQETIEESQTELQAERAAMDLALAELVAVDPYEVATRLTEVEAQIDMLYHLTVRSSNMKLANYL